MENNQELSKEEEFTQQVRDNVWMITESRQATFMRSAAGKDPGSLVITIELGPVK